MIMTVERSEHRGWETIIISIHVLFFQFLLILLELDLELKLKKVEMYEETTCYFYLFFTS